MKQPFDYVTSLRKGLFYVLALALTLVGAIVPDVPTLILGSAAFVYGFDGNVLRHVGIVVSFDGNPARFSE